MDVSRPWAPVASRHDLEALRVLAGTTRPLTGREVARLVEHGSQTTINAALRRLTREGLVHASEHGPSILYVLNRRHLAADPIIALVGARARLVERLRGHFADWSPSPYAAVLFGSAARGDGDADSDIDVLLVRPVDAPEDDQAWARQVQRLRDDIHAWTGNRAGFTEVAEDDLRALADARPPVVDSIVRDGIRLHGPEPAALFDVA
jgi:DNA-binding transcriptional ArsR family regulator